MRTFTRRVFYTLGILTLAIVFPPIATLSAHSLFPAQHLHAGPPHPQSGPYQLFLPNLIGTGPTSTPTPTPSPTQTSTPTIPPSPTPTPTPTVPAYGPEVCENFMVSDDTYVDPNAPGFHGNDPKLTVSATAKAFLYANLLPIPTGSLITNASLVMHVASVWGVPEALTLHQVLQPWRENWISHRVVPQYITTAQTEVTYTGAGPYSLDVRSLVQEWVNAQWPNVGVVLVWKGEGAWGNWQIYSSESPPATRPYFHVCYRAPQSNRGMHTPPERTPFQFVGYGNDVATSVAVWGTTLLVGGPGEVRLYDLTSPTRPRLRTRVELGGPLITDIHVQGGIAHMVQDRKVILLDITESPPRVLGRLNLGSLARQITTTEDGRYAFVNSMAGVVSIDVSDPTHPRGIALYPTSFTVAGMASQGDHLYIWGNAGHSDTRFEVLHVNQQGELQPVAALLIPGVTTIASNDGDGGMVITDSKAYFGAQPIVVDVSHPAQPVVIHRDGWIGPVVDMAQGDGHLFTVSLDGRVKAIDIHTPSSPVERYTFTLPRDMESHLGSATYRIARQGRYIYAAMGEHGVIILRR